MPMKFNAEEIYKKIKTQGNSKYIEEIHCPMILRIMNDKNKGTMSAFCVEAIIGDTIFYDWLNRHDIFLQCYAIGKMVARENWEQEGREIREIPGLELGCRMEHWRMIGWSRFGVGKNSRIRLNLNPNNNPAEHYAQLLRQASQGDFTAGEIKQLMEAVNVGLNAHQVFELQKEIDQLKSDLIKMNELRNGENTYTNKGLA